MDSLKHNGILVIDPPPYLGLTIAVRGSDLQLSPLQEEMAFAFVKKFGTPYVEDDDLFVENFMTDFSKALGVSPRLEFRKEIFVEVKQVVDTERARKENMTPEEKKADREARKVIREELKEKLAEL